MNDLYRRFTFPGEKNQQSFLIAYTAYGDYHLSIRGGNGYTDNVLIRGPGGAQNVSIAVLMKLKNIVQRTLFKSAKQFERLEATPIVVFHEHQEPGRDRLIQMIFQKKYSFIPILTVQTVVNVDDILKKTVDIVITSNPDGLMQMDLFEEVPEADRVDLKNLVYMSTRDLNELASLLSSILVHQRRRYQGAVNELLKKLPPIKEESPSN